MQQAQKYRMRQNYIYDNVPDASKCTSSVRLSSDYCQQQGYKVKYRVQAQKSSQAVYSICSIRCPEGSTDHYWGWTETSSLQSSTLKNKQLRVQLVHSSYVGFMKMFFASYCIFSLLRPFYSQTEVILRICMLITLYNICFIFVPNVPVGF